MAVKKSFRGGWLLRFHLLLRLAGLTGLLVAAVGLALVLAESDWSSVQNLRNSLSAKFQAMVAEPGEDVALLLARFMLPIGLAITLLALIVEIWVATRTVAGRRSAFGTNVLFQIALAFVLVVGANVYSYLHYVRFDCTRDRQFTLDPDLQKQLRDLKTDTPTTIVVFIRHQAFGWVSDKPENRDEYDSAAEQKVAEKVRDLADQFREFGPQFRVEVIDIGELGKKEKLDRITMELAEEALQQSPLKRSDPGADKPREEQVADRAKEFRATIESAPENSIFFFAGGREQRLSFNDFYQLDKRSSQEANGGRGNLVLLAKGAKPFARRVLNIQEKRPTIALGVIHELLGFETGDEEIGMAGAKKVLREHGFNTRDVILKKWGGFAGLEAAVLTYDENKYEDLETQLVALDATIKALEKELKIFDDLLIEWRTKPLAELKKTDLAKQFKVEDEEDRRDLIQNLLQPNRGFRQLSLEGMRKERGEANRERSQLVEKNVLENIDEQRRITDLRAKLDRKLADADLLIIPRMTLFNIPRGRRIESDLYNLEESQVNAIKDFLQAGKSVLFCLGPSNEPSPSFGRPPVEADALEKMLGELGIKLPKQTILFDVETKSFGERRGGLTILGGTAEVPSVDLDWQPGAGLLNPLTAKDRHPQAIRESMRLTARSLGKDQSLDLRIRHPRPVYYEPQWKEKLTVQPEFIMTSPLGWNDDQPFPTRERIPRYEPAKPDDRDKGTVSEKRRGPFPIGVAVEAKAPAEWSSDKAAKPATARIAVIGHGGVFMGPKITPAQERLLLDTCNWLLSRDDRLTEDKARWEYPRVDLTPRDQALWLMGGCVGLPLLFLYLGSMVLMVRRLR